MKLKKAALPLLALSAMGILACNEDSSTSATPSSAVSCDVTTSGNTVTMTYKAGTLTSTTTTDIGEDSVMTTIKATWSYASGEFEAACTGAREDAEEENENLENFECNGSGYSYNYTEANEGTTVSETKAGFEYACSLLESAANSSSSNSGEETASSSSAKTDLSSSSNANNGESSISSSSEDNSETSSNYSSSEDNEDNSSSSESDVACNVTTSGNTITLSITEGDTSATEQIVVEEDSITTIFATKWSLSAADVETICSELNAEMEEEADGYDLAESCNANGSSYSYKTENLGFTITDIASIFEDACSEESSYANAKINALKKVLKLVK